MPDALLTTSGLTKRYGAVIVADDISLSVNRGECHALIGPNGAGKTTLVAQLCGTIRPDSGVVSFSGREITHDPAVNRVRAGLARTYQISTVLPEFTALENVATAVQARSGSSFRFFRRASSERHLNKQAASILDRVGLADRAMQPAGSLAHGEKRALELAIALALKPKLLLLDEPMAGTGREETDRLVEILRDLRGSLAMLLIEHDMEAVFALADRVSVLVGGRLLITDRPQVVRSDPAVVGAYLGEDARA